MLKRRLLKFAAVATMVVPTAVATALAATSASATTAVPAFSHSTAASTAGHAATASQARGAALVVRSDLAAGCVNITNAQGLAIAGHGVNAPVRLEASGNCFTKVFTSAPTGTSRRADPRPPSDSGAGERVLSSP